ncbi:hypothetical protein [Blastopirellula marina]|uniref:DUF2092 domain-containing protein n=1 Tax=Blastopirellula marina TaxID=124 RepID=A0A2S8GF78_9BACT|nr:hypothetical protein [Blastopirellula marina]PQO43125.1 hypothetical protein C5Y93_25795 [Blastopirellula marina]
MSDNRRNLTLVIAGVLLAVFTAVCAFGLPSFSYFAKPHDANAVDVASTQLAKQAGGDAEPLLHDALKRVLGYSSITARIEYSTRSPETNGSGHYWEQGALQRRLELKLRGVESAGLLQINNGKTLWTRCTTPRDTMTTEAPTAAPLHSPQLHLAELGLPGLLSQLKQDYDLVLVGAGQLAGEQVFVIKGVLKRDALVRMTPTRAAEIQAGGFSAWSELPPGVPATLLIALGSEDAIPRRIQLQTIADGAPLSSWPELPTEESLTIDLRDVHANLELKYEVFARPPI